MQKEGLEIKKIIGSGSVRVFRPLAIPASGTTAYTKDAAVNAEKSSVECSMNNDSVRTPRKNPYTSTNITLTHVMQSVNQKEKILDHFFHSVQNPFHEQIYRNLTLN